MYFVVLILQTLKMIGEDLMNLGVVIDSMYDEINIDGAEDGEDIGSDIDEADDDNLFTKDEL